MPGKSGKNSAVRQFLEKNKSLAFLLPLLVILIVVLIIVYSGNSDMPASSDVTVSPSPGTPVNLNDKTRADILPQTERPSEELNWEEIRQDPFAAPMKLTGILRYPDDRTKAIIEYSGAGFIVRKNDYIGKSPWKVTEIYETSVMLEADGKSQLLELEPGSAGRSANAEYINPDPGTMTIRLAETDIRDVISALVLDLGYNVVYLNNTVIVERFDGTNLPPLEALALLLKSEGLDYIQDGNTMIVGSSDTLNTVFFDSMVLTRFSLNYVDARTISSQIENLKLPVTKITLDTNPNAIWVQGLPRELGKVRELIAILDKPENVSSAVSVSKVTAINLTYITARQMNDILRGVGLQTGLYLESNPKLLYVYADENQLAQIMELKSKLDIPENQTGTDFIVSMKKLTYIKAKEVVPIVYELGLGVDVITFDRTARAVWLKGDEAAVNRVSSIIDMIDIQQNIDNNRFFIKKLKNISALEADYRLKLLGIPEIKTYTFSYPQFSKCILVVCPEDYKIFVMDHLNQFDVVADKIKVPIDYSDDASGTYRLEQRLELLVTLTGIPKESFMISRNISRDNNPYFVLILEETPERIKMVEDLIDKLDNPRENEYEPNY